MSNNNDQNDSSSFDIYRYLIGNWKRCLEFRQFGGLFQHLFTTNTVVSIEEFNRFNEHTSGSAENVRYLRWRFGKDGNGYEMAVKATVPAAATANSSNSSNSFRAKNGGSSSSLLSPSLRSSSSSSGSTAQKQTRFEWQVAGTTCEGWFYHESKVAIFHFILSASIVTVTYRIVDDNTMAVSIVELDDKYQPTIQYGNMYRL